MRKLAAMLAILLLVVVLLPAAGGAGASSSPQVKVNSQYVINRYGYAIINETVTFVNNGTSAEQVPDVSIGFTQNVTALIAAYNVTGTGYTLGTGTSSGQPVYTVSGSGVSLQPNSSSTFSFKALVTGMTFPSTNNTLSVVVMLQPYLSVRADSAKLLVKMPASTQLKDTPKGFTESYTGLNVTYYDLITTPTSLTATGNFTQVQTYSQQDFYPISVYSASRSITVSSNGSPLVRDYLRFKNDGVTSISTLTVTPLTPVNSQITVLPSSEPPLLSPTTVTLSKFGIDLTNTAIALPVAAGANFSITYTYPLGQQYYTISGDKVTINIPLSAPIAASVDSYTLNMTAQPGVTLDTYKPVSAANVTPFTTGQTQFAYGVSVGWALDGGVPIASLLFVITLVGLFAARTQSTGGEEEEEEGSSTEGAWAMIKAFEEKTSLINSMFEEIPKMDPNEMDKAHFDEYRSKLDVFRSKGIQRLNELRQRSGSRRFSDLLNQIQETEREVDRAAKDMLNLYDQHYTRRMRTEVFERLQPNYRKRLDRALNQLSDELNTAQREAKLL